MRIGFVYRTNSNGVIEIGRISDGKIHVGRNHSAGGIKQRIAFVARCKTDQYSLLPQSPQFLTQRCMPATKHTGIEAASQAEIHSVNNQLAGALIQCGNRIKRLDDKGIFPATIILQHLKTIQLCFRCHTLQRDLGFILVVTRQSQRTGNGGCNMRAVTIPIQCVETFISRF